MWVISMKKENKWIVAVVCAVVAAALVVALALLLPGQGEDQPQVSAPTGDVTEPSDPGNVTEPSDTAGVGTEEPGADHVHTWTETVTAPDCTEGGYTTFTCACGESYTDNETRALGHDWADATCKDPRICKRCDTTEGKALGHNYNSVVTEPTKTEQGYTTHTCTRCGDSYVDNYTNLDGKQYDPGTLLFCTDGQALLYGENGKVSKTYTGWVTGSYGAYYTQEPPWYQDRRSIRKAIIEDGISLKDIAAWFRGCENLEEVKLGDGVKLIGDYAFYECYKLKSVELPGGVTSIGAFAFGECSGLQSIRIPAGVTKLGTFAFYQCTGLTSVEFDKESLLTSMESFAFSNCSSLVAIHIPASVTSIGVSALSGCHALASMTVAPENPVYQSQGNCIIETATKILAVGCKESVIPIDGSVTALGADAFSNCDSLTKIHIPAVITKIDASALAYCNNLVKITVDEQNPAYLAKGNCLIRKADSTLVTACKGSVIPADGSVTHIGSKAFTGNSLTAIHIPANITRIDDRAFSYCEGLITVTFADDSRLDSIGNYAFERCIKLTDPVIPSSVTRIGDHAFDSCYGIRSVAFGENSRLASIGHYAFGYCANLESIVFGGTVDQWNAVSKGTQWCDATLATEVVCTDGNVAI